MTQTTGKKLFVAGTTGSTDYLRDGAGTQRFWSITPSAHSEDPGICDGLHDEGAPAHYLCTRCFPDLSVADPVEQQDEAYEENCCANDPETE